MKKALALVLTLLLVVATLAGCGGDDSPATSGGAPAASTSGSASGTGGSPQEMLEVKMSCQYAVQQGVPFMAAQNQDLFTKYGIQIQDQVPFYSAGAPQLEAQPGGEWEIGLIGYTAAITAATKYDMEIIGMCGFDNGDQVLCRTDSDIYKEGTGHIDGYPNIYGSADTWRGKTIITTLGTTRDVCLQLVLATMGLTYDDVTILNMDNESSKTAFESGQADLWLPTSTSAAQALVAHDDYASIANIADVDCAMFNTIVATRSYLAENEDAAVRFLATFLDASLWCHEDANKDTMADYYMQLMKENQGVEYTPDEAAACVDLVNFPDLAFFEGLGETSSSGMTDFQDYCAKFFDAHVMVGIADEADKETVLNACNTTYLDKAIELYKTDNA